MEELTVGERAAARYALEKLTEAKAALTSSRLPLLIYLVEMAAIEAGQISGDESYELQVRHSDS